MRLNAWHHEDALPRPFLTITSRVPRTFTPTFGTMNTPAAGLLVLLLLTAAACTGHRPPPMVTPPGAGLAYVAVDVPEVIWTEPAVRMLRGLFRDGSYPRACVIATVYRLAGSISESPRYRTRTRWLVMAATGTLEDASTACRLPGEHGLVLFVRQETDRKYLEVICRTVLSERLDLGFVHAVTGFSFGSTAGGRIGDLLPDGIGRVRLTPWGRCEFSDVCDWSPRS